MGSWVHGSPEAIAETQQSAVHYFQRPDDDAASFDPKRTSLSGVATRWQVGQFGDTKHWRFGAGGDLRTAGLELNDAGYQVNSDRVVPYFALSYREDAPSANVLNWQVGGDVFWVQTFEPRLLDTGLELNGNIQFSNYWQLSAYSNFDQARWNTNSLRGGRALRVDPGAFSNIYVQTDNRKPVWFSVGGYGSNNWTTGGRDGGIDLGATIQARSNLDVFVGPSIYHRNEPMQYIDQVGDDAAMAPDHFVFGRLHETDLSMTLRVNWTFSPHLTLQAYAQPYIATGYYGEFKDVDNPAAERFTDRFHALPSSELQLTDGAYRAMRNGSSFSFDQPDFNFRQLRSTVVMRWEYRPGSTVFAIWSHGRTSDEFDGGRFRFGNEVSELASARSENIVMVKANYWIGL